MTAEKSILDHMNREKSELKHAVTLTEQAAIIGFDWPSIIPVFDKLNEEVSELKEAIETGKPERMLDELGDVLFVCTNLARHLSINPQQALKHANIKFEKRFRSVESIAKSISPKKDHFNLELLENIWNEVKILEQANINK